MLLLILEKGLPLDEVVFYDTGMEFKAIYNIRDRAKTILLDKGIAYTELHPPRDFLFDMLYRTKTKRDGSVVNGDGWCGGPCRWGTFIKQRTINKHTAGAHVYLGIAADEQRRLAKLEANKSSPIAEAGTTESDCLAYCHKNGFYWYEDGVELYSVLDRVSCWCCCNKNIKELRNIYHYLPQYWDRLKDLQSKIEAPMKGRSGSVFDLEERFRREDEEQKR